MIKKILILANMSIFTFILTGCPSQAVQDEVYKQQHKQEVLQRSDKQFQDMDREMNQ